MSSTKSSTTMQGGMLLILSMSSVSCLLESNKKQLFENATLNFDFIAGHFQAQDISQLEYLETSLVRQTNNFDCHA